MLAAGRKMQADIDRSWDALSKSEVAGASALALHVVNYESWRAPVNTLAACVWLLMLLAFSRHPQLDFSVRAPTRLVGSKQTTI